MKENIFTYLNTYYLTIEQLAIQADVAVERIQTLITTGCIPPHSHKVTQQTTFQTNIFGEVVIMEEEKLYYHPSLVSWIKQAGYFARTANLSDVAKRVKENFIQELCNALQNVEGANNIFDYCFDVDGKLNEFAVNKVFAEEWPYVMDGTYGVCLKKGITAENIVTKAIVVKLLEKFIDHKNSELTEEQLQELEHSMQRYDDIASCFGPHEIHKSSRQRVFNKASAILNE